jgi:alpha-beta hydrolase superfamily lysophospholipase
MEANTFILTDLIADKLHCEIWKPSGRPKFAMILVHGLGEHCNRYKGDFSEFFTSHGAVIYTFDLPGHGKSGGKRGHIRQYEDLNTIISGLLTRIKKDYPSLPVFIYGHSLGGLISSVFLLEKQPTIQGAILSAPALDVENPLPPLKIALAKMMNKVFPAITLDNGLERDKLSKDKDVVDRYNSDPLVHGLASARLGAFIIDKGKYVLDNAQLLSKPALIMVGADEAIVSKSAIDSFCESSKLCTKKIWEGMYHEIHNEKDKQAVFQYTLDWMKKTA